jgi:hypothetical protein
MRVCARVTVRRARRPGRRRGRGVGWAQARRRDARWRLNTSSAAP